MKKTLLSFFISLAPLFLFAQDALLKDSSEKFKIDAELRVRGNVFKRIQGTSNRIDLTKLPG
jgi:hypothetical protein